MPNILSHASFAYRIGSLLNCFTDENTQAIFLLGSYGPDVYFFDRLPPTPFHPNQKKHGNLLHSAKCDELALSLIKHTDSSLKPFLYGFLTHIALDSTLHPYICARYSGPDHTRFESDIDSVMFDRFHDSVPFADAVKIPESINDIDCLVTNVSFEVVKQAVPGAYKRSLKKMSRMYKLMYDPDASRLRSVSSIERLFGKERIVSGFLLGPGHHYFPDCMNESHSIWIPKLFPDEKRTESVDELFASAEILAQNILNATMHDDIKTVISLLSNRTMENGPLPKHQ